MQSITFNRQHSGIPLSKTKELFLTITVMTYNSTATDRNYFLVLEEKMPPMTLLEHQLFN
jgi:hypothetical protein